jgi:hypothetical protein
MRQAPRNETAFLGAWAFICRFQPMAADNEPTTLVGGQIALANEARRGETSAASRGVDLFTLPGKCFACYCGRRTDVAAADITINGFWSLLSTV